MSGHFFLCGLFQQFVNERLVRLALLGGEATELRQQSRSNADGDELLGVPCLRPSDAPGTLEFFVGGFGDVGEINFAIRAAIWNMLSALCGLPVARG